MITIVMLIPKKNGEYINMEAICLLQTFEPVEDKPGYYWFNKRNFQIISEEVLERAIKEYEASHKLLLPDP